MIIVIRRSRFVVIVIKRSRFVVIVIKRSRFVVQDLTIAGVYRGFRPGSNQPLNAKNEPITL
ncbi:MAG: hypothetical protein ABSD38_06100 [Syntrophorhabdales bacterium]